MTTFTVPGVPIAQPRQRHTRAGVNYLPAGHPVNAFKAAVKMAAHQAGLCPITGPVTLWAEFILPKPVSRTRRKDAGKAIAVATKPDADNLAKAVLDGLTGIAWRDDCQVASLFIQKRYTVTDSDGEAIESPRCVVTIKELEA